MCSAVSATCLRSRHGFTLIEVLVVVAIIALLISILLPSLSIAKEKSRQAVCLSNLHQIGLSLQMYLDKYRYFPPVSTEKGEAGRWPRLIVDVRSAAQATLNPKSSFLKTMTCPTVSEWAQALTLKNHRMDRDISYGYNYIYLGDSRWLWKPGKGRFPVPVSWVKFTAQTIAFSDSDGTGGWCPNPNPYTPNAADPNAIGHHGFMIDPPELPEDAENGPAYSPEKCTMSTKPGFSRVSDRHNGGANVAYVDGHAQWVKRDRLEINNFPWNGEHPEP